MADPQREDEFSDEEESGAFDDRRPAHDEDNDFDFDGSAEMRSGGGCDAVVQNQPFDEAVELSDHESEQPSPLASNRPGGGGLGGGGFGGGPPGTVQNRPHDEEYEVDSETSVNDEEAERQQREAERGAVAPSTAAASRMQQQPAEEEAPRYERRPEAPTLTHMAQAPQLREMPEEESPARGAFGSSVHRDFGSMGGGEDEDVLRGKGMPVPEGMYDPREYEGMDVAPQLV